MYWRQSSDKLSAEQAVELILQALTYIKQEDAGRPVVRAVEAVPILAKAIDEALNLLEAAGRA